MKTLILFAHTFWKDSKVNKALLEYAQDLPNVKIHNLSEVYPDSVIDVNAEIALLKDADKIIFEFPLFWFSTPALLKEWQDRVLSAILYGSTPKLLEGKKFQVITTLGGAEQSYDGHHGAGLKELLSPIHHSFAYNGCVILDFYAIFSAKVATLDFNAYQKQIES